jgi:cysteine-rich repeat protein
MPEPQKIQKPAETKPTFPEPVIKTMPEKYIGAPAGKPPAVREVVETKAQAPAPPPLPPAPAKTQPPKNRRLMMIMIAGAVLLAGLGTAAYVIMVPAEPSAPPPKNANVPQAVCGNGTVESGEQCDLGGQNGASGAVCSVSCRTVSVPPKPVCGNGTVESGEQCDLGSQNGAEDSGCSAICEKIEVKPAIPNTGVDSDSDGLTDVEEASVYGTNPYDVDSDNDTFNDGNEVSHLYDPMKKAPSSLGDSASMLRVENTAQGYSVLVPAKWTLSGDKSPELIAAAPTGEFFMVVVAQKAKEQSLVEWYLSLSPGSAAEDVERVKTLQGYDALRSPDRLTTYVDAGDGRVFTIAYSYDGQAHLEFRTTYHALIGSFALEK